MRNLSHYIAGDWLPGSGPEFTNTDPATGQITWQGRLAITKEIDAAVVAARRAYERWSETALSTRIDHLHAFANGLANHRESLARTISHNTGKPYWESSTEVASMIGKIDLSIRAYQERCRSTTIEVGGAAGVTRFKPHGVCAVLGPFNLPGHLPNGHIVPAVLAGNTVVFKPSELAAAVGQMMIEVWSQAHLPPGVINMVQGGSEVGIALSEHSDIDGLFFTGGYTTGQALARTFAERPGKILALELGGNNPLIVWDVENPVAAAYATIQSAFITAGQRCSCTRRLIIPQGPAGDGFLTQLTDVMKRIRVGPCDLVPEPFMGPLICKGVAKRLLDAQASLRAAGGTPIVEMKAIDGMPGLLCPGLIDVTGIANRPDQELFGPLVQVIRVADFDAAIREANNTRYGLAAGLLSDRRDLYESFIRRVRAGVIHWNRPTTGASGAMPFGGVGISGNHRPSGYYATDYCSYPVASIESERVILPSQPTPGIAM
jgi:succinylglutamic semialdehyde dehydrogenase